ncbi:MAG: hypothetical protein RLY86_2918 [Pseudomonadota bacterium]|jgi:competence protein ComEC
MTSITTGFASGITPGIAQAPDDGAPIEGFPQGADLDLYAPPRRRTPMERVRDWLDARIAGESGRHILWAPVGIGIGIVGYFALAREPHPGSGLLALVLSSLMLAARFGWLRRIGLVLLLLAIGFGAGQIRTNMVASPLLTVETRPTLVEGRVIAVDRLEKGQRVLLGDVVVERLAADRTPARVRLRLKPSDTGAVPEPGERIRLLAILTPPGDPAEPGAYDFRRHAFFQRIGAVGFALRDVEHLPTPPPEGWQAVTIAAQKLRTAIADRVALHLAGPEGAVATALLTGQTTAIPDSDLEAMRISGLQHLLSISGLHVGLVAGLVFAGLRAAMALVPPLALRYPIKKWAGAAALLAAFAYMLLVGAPVPTQRAVLMTAIMLLAVLLDRNPFSIRVVAAAAVAVMLAQPEALVGPSFQMSFAAVIALIAGYEVIRNRLVADKETGPIGRAWLYLVGLSATSLLAGTATMPYAMFHFQQMANYGVLANLLAVPITSFWVMPFGLIALILMPFGLEGWAVQAMGWGVTGILWTAHAVAALPMAAFQVPAMPIWGLALISLGGLWLVIWRGAWRVAALPVILLGFATPWLAVRPDILIAGDGGLVGLRAPNGILHLSSARTGRFEAEIWGERDGMAEPLPAWGPTGAEDGWVRCDPSACIARVKGWTIAQVRRADALAEDCRNADIVITRVEVGRRPREDAGSARTGARADRPAADPGTTRCAAPVIVAPTDLERHGAHALYLPDQSADPGEPLNLETVRIETVRQGRGHRPWN